jgi:hypothetical protein
MAIILLKYNSRNTIAKKTIDYIVLNDTEMYFIYRYNVRKLG